MHISRQRLNLAEGTCQHQQRSPGFACTALSKADGSQHKTLIKICGVVNKHDASLAAQAGADFVGMIMWPKARRSVSTATAAEISEAARQHGAEPVAVFVDEDFADIVRSCKAAGIGIAQLHGKAARASLPDLPNWLQVIYVMHAGPDGSLQTKSSHPPADQLQQARVANWLLLDGLKGGSGEAYDWEKLQRPPLQESMSGWLLAGGLTPENVGKALSLAQPTGVDVSSGVTQPDGLLKDPEKVHKFVQQVWNNSA